MAFHEELSEDEEDDEEAIGAVEYR